MTGLKSTGNWVDRTILLLLIVVQAVLCYNFYAREIAWYPPSNFDQTGYLATAYYVEHSIRANGFVELLRAIGSRGHQTGLALLSKVPSRPLSSVAPGYRNCSQSF